MHVLQEGKFALAQRLYSCMPFYLSLANFANGIVWACYALLKFDPYILIPNGLGSLSGLVQLILFAAFYRTTNWDEDEKEVEQSTSKSNKSDV